MIRSIMLILWCLILAGCAASFKKSEKDLQVDISQNQLSESEVVMLIADNQESLEYRQGVFETSTVLVDFGLRSANRPRALTKWGIDIVNHVIEREAESNLLIHLGDVLNNSCKTEWDEISKTLNQSGKTWFIVPGNHDGYYFGITSPTPNQKITNVGILNQYYGGWGAVCVPLHLRAGDSNSAEQDLYILDKADFVSSYLEELEIRGLKIKSSAKEVFGRNYSYKCSHVSDRYLSDICWNVDKEKPWLSFVLQNINIYDSDDENVIARLIAIDTSSFPWQPDSPSKNAFNPVELTPQVIQVVSKWIEGSQTFSTIIAGHHPFYKFKHQGREKMLEWWDKDLYLAYLSGDTHDGMATRYNTSKCMTKDKCGLLEINVGSLLDAPIEYRTLKIVGTGNDNHHVLTNHVFVTPPHNTDREGYLRHPSVIDPKYDECQSFIEENDFEIFNEFKSNKHFDFLLKKGYLTQIEKLIAEASLYLQLIFSTNATEYWLSVSLNTNVASPCSDHKGANVYDSLRYMTIKNAKQCLTDESSATIILMNMSKNLEEISRKIDQYYTHPDLNDMYSSYKLCLALSASDKELCNTKSFWNSNSITSKQYFLSGSCSDAR